LGTTNNTRNPPNENSNLPDTTPVNNQRKKLELKRDQLQLELDKVNNELRKIENNS